MGKEDVAGLSAWNKASEVAEAYSIGRTESAAALCLHKEVEPEVVRFLAQQVQSFDAVQ